MPEPAPERTPPDDTTPPAVCEGSYEWWRTEVAARDAELAEIKRVTDPPGGNEEMPTDPAELRELWEFINRQARWQWHMAHKFGTEVERLRAELADALHRGNTFRDDWGAVTERAEKAEKAEAMLKMAERHAMRCDADQAAAEAKLARAEARYAGLNAHHLRAVADYRAELDAIKAERDRTQHLLNTLVHTADVLAALAVPETAPDALTEETDGR